MSKVWSMDGNGLSESWTESWTENVQQPIVSSFLTPKSYSNKVFLGGLPGDVTDSDIVQELSRYGRAEVEIDKRSIPKSRRTFAYVIFLDPSAINKMLLDCIKSPTEGSMEYYYHFGNTPNSNKRTQIIPWSINNNSASRDKEQNADDFEMGQISRKLTVYVGGLHGKITAQKLMQAMETLFNNVSSAELFTDKFAYPTGSGKVSFGNADSYKRAVREKYVTIITQKISSHTEVKPFIDRNEACIMCGLHPAGNYCSAVTCMDYFCDECWASFHSIEGRTDHSQIKRK
jgi:cytoplasmic polyadenylation element-binding protein